MGYMEVPILSKDQIETESYKVMAAYDPSLIEEPAEVDIEHLIEQYFKLNVDYQVLSKQDDDILGLIAITGGALTVFDRSTLEKRRIEVAPQTVIIDERLAMSDSQIGRFRFTIAHEASHWHLHRFYCEDENQTKLFADQDATAIKCFSRNIERRFASSFSDKSPLDWLEWQADYMASTLLMPAKSFKTAFQSLSPSSRIYNPQDNECQRIITSLANLFKVSKQAARIRLLHLGLFKNMHSGQTSFL